MEEKIYSRSVTKQAMSRRVIDKQQVDRKFSMAELDELYELHMPDFANRPQPNYPEDALLKSLLQKNPEIIYRYSAEIAFKKSRHETNFFKQLP